MLICTVFMNKIFTSESVCSGHPDKVCDQVSDAVLDEALRVDPLSRVAVETLVGANICVMAGEVTSNANLDYEAIARDVIRKLGYTKEEYGFWHKSPIELFIHSQSTEIAAGVDDLGAGDQGMMFGFACRETPELMPLSIMMAHKLAMGIDGARENGKMPFLRPDGKSQVTLEYEGGKPAGIRSIVVAVPHDPEVKVYDVKEQIFEHVVKSVLGEYDMNCTIDDVILNGTGVWHSGGPASDTGVTGRKIIVDTYGSMAHVGGGAFSGKDPTKVDRSGAYGARYLAKNIVASGLADMCEVRLAYCIGHKKPVMQDIETFGTEKKPIDDIKKYMDRLLDTSVAGIIEGLDLRQPIYFKSASYGHFGRDFFPWEKIAV